MIAELALIAGLTLTPTPGIPGTPEIPALGASDAGLVAGAALAMASPSVAVEEMRSRRSPFAPRARSPHAPPARGGGAC